MIHMLSRYDLKSDIEPGVFETRYRAFVKEMQLAGLVEHTGPIGRRVQDSPMDTDAETAPEFYVVMSFRDRDQLDRAYDRMTDRASRDATTHPDIHTAVCNATFTCWQDEE